VSIPLQGHRLSFPDVRSRSGSSLACVSPAAIQVESPSDEEIMIRLSTGDSSALRLLFDRYSRLVLGIAFRVLRDHAEAEEVVQEVFFHIFQKAKLFDPARGTPKGWIVQIAYYRTLDQKSYLARRDFYRGTDIGSMHDTLLGDADLDREVESRLNHVWIEKAFRELPALQRQTLELFYFEGLELREIGDRLNTSLGNVRHHFYRGLERLRKNAFVQMLRDK
jgi:RNA polymerase sigma-70 factor (ECF subfamily)